MMCNEDHNNCNNTASSSLTKTANSNTYSDGKKRHDLHEYDPILPRPETSETSNEEVKMNRQLLRLIKNNPILYSSNLKSDDYAETRDSTWKKIAIELNLTAELCQAKWAQLKTIFIKRKKRHDLKIKVGFPPLSSEPKWIYYEDMKFLLPYKKLYSRSDKYLSYFLDHNDDAVENFSSKIYDSSKSEGTFLENIKITGIRSVRNKPQITKLKEKVFKTEQQDVIMNTDDEDKKGGMKTVITKLEQDENIENNLDQEQDCEYINTDNVDHKLQFTESCVPINTDKIIIDNNVFNEQYLDKTQVYKSCRSDAQYLGNNDIDDSNRSNKRIQGSFKVEVAGFSVYVDSNKDNVQFHGNIQDNHYSVQNSGNCGTATNKSNIDRKIIEQQYHSESVNEYYKHLSETYNTEHGYNIHADYKQQALLKFIKVHPILVNGDGRVPPVRIQQDILWDVISNEINLSVQECKLRTQMFKGHKNQFITKIITHLKKKQNAIDIDNSKEIHIEKPKRNEIKETKNNEIKETKKNEIKETKKKEIKETKKNEIKRRKKKEKEVQKPHTIAKSVLSKILQNTEGSDNSPIDYDVIAVSEEVEEECSSQEKEEVLNNYISSMLSKAADTKMKEELGCYTSFFCQ